MSSFFVRVGIDSALSCDGGEPFTLLARRERFWFLNLINYDAGRNIQLPERSQLTNAFPETISKSFPGTLVRTDQDQSVSSDSFRLSNDLSF